MSRLITDKEEILSAIKRLHFEAEIPQKLLAEWLSGVRIPRGESMSGPMVRLQMYRPGEVVMREGEWGGNDFRILVEGKLDVFMRDDTVYGSPLDPIVLWRTAIEA